MVGTVNRIDPSHMTESGSQSQREGPVARAIEQQTAKLPSDLFLWAALGSIGASLLLQCHRAEAGEQLRRPVGTDVPPARPVQQDRQGRRLGPGDRVNRHVPADAAALGGRIGARNKAAMPRRMPKRWSAARHRRSVR